jgi:hypothetical protein
MRKRSMVSGRLVQVIEQLVLDSEERDPEAKWRHVMFDTVRVLKSDLETKNMNEQEAATVAEECLAQCGWDFTRYDGIEDNDHGREEFMAQWTACLYGCDEGPLDLALKRANAKPLSFESDCLFAFYQAFVNLCYQLSRINGEDPIALPVHEVGKRLQVSGATIGVYIKRATQEGYLVQVGKHFHRNGCEGGKARTYHFYPNRNPVATQLMRD